MKDAISAGLGEYPPVADAAAPYARQWPAIGLLAGLVGGVIDLIATVGLQMAMGTTPGRVLQAIASGVLGRAAFAGGAGSAALGFVLHLAISIVCGLAFGMVAERNSAVARHRLVAGACLGLLVYLIMRYIVLPLSPVAFSVSDRPSAVAVSVLFHIFAFGIPIALVTASRLTKRVRAV